MNNEDNSPALSNLHTTTDDAIEILAAFQSAAAGPEVPHEKLVVAARQVAQDLGVWREKVGAIVGRGDDGVKVH
jgi:hypothetical protein